MSLFQAKEWWGIRITASEEFDERHLQVDDIDNTSDVQQKIILGSFQGLLRIYSPKRGEYRLEHLLFEQDLGAPIMQILTGNFVKPLECTLCVLFFKKVVFYMFQSTQMGGIQFRLIKEHKLERNAFNMCKGQFGGVKKDIICIQSCDAMLMIYEAEKMQCMCQLSTEFFPLPGPIIYNPQMDAFILQNSCYELESYKYSNIVATSQTQVKENKRPQPDWTVNLGELAMKLVAVQRLYYSKSNSLCDIVIITDAMLFVVSQTGRIRNQKKLDYPPASILINSYPELKDEIQDPATNETLTSLNFIISSFTHHLMIYKDFRLQWAAKTDQVCHGIQLGTFENERGLITIMNDEGWLQVIYLGTEVSTVQNDIQSPVIQTYQEMEKNYNIVLQKIAEKEGPGAQKKDEENVNFNLNYQVFDTIVSDQYIEDPHLYSKINNKVCVTTIKLTLTTNTILSNVSLLFNCDPGTICIPDKFNVGTFKFGTPLVINLNVYSSSTFLIKERKISINSTACSKVRGSSVSHCFQTNIDVPFTQYCLMVPPSKQAEYKITLCVNDVVPLFQLFEDMMQFQKKYSPDTFQDCTSNGNAMGARLNNGTEVTILISKNQDKWRVQSNQFEALGALLCELIIRFEKFPKASLSFVDQISFSDFFAVIDEHYTLRLSLMAFEKDLEAKAIEFRTIQKKLLSRFKEKNPSSSEGLILLMETSLNQFLQLMENTQQCKSALISQSQKVDIIKTNSIVRNMHPLFGLIDQTEIQSKCFLVQSIQKCDILRYKR